MPAEGRRPVAHRTLELLALASLLGLAVISQHFPWLPAGAAAWLGFTGLVVVPGVLLLRLAAPALELDWLEEVLLGCAAGFALWLFWCLGAMNLGGSALLAARGQVALGVLLLGGAALAGRLGDLVAGIGADLKSLRRGGAGTWRVGVAAGLAWVGYLSTGYFRHLQLEEMLILRKLADMPVLSVDDIMQKAGETSTYLYPLWLFLNAAVARLSGVDVLVVQLKFNSLAAVLALLAHYALARVLLGRAEWAGGYTLFLAALVLASPDPWSFGLGILAPFNNRFGVAPGVLLPIALVLTCHLYRTPRCPALWALFALHGFFTSLVHAREGVHLMLFAFGWGIALVLFRTADSGGLKRLGLGCLLLLLLLGLFKVHHQAQVEHFRPLARELKAGLEARLGELIRDPLYALLGAEERTIHTFIGDYSVGYLARFHAEYRRHTLKWYLFLGCLAAIAWSARGGGWPVAFLWTSVFLPALVMRVPLLYLLLDRAAGTPDAEILAPLLVQGCLLSAAGLALRAFAWLEPLEQRVRWWSDLPASRRRLRRTLAAVAVLQLAFWVALRPLQRLLTGDVPTFLALILVVSAGFLMRRRCDFPPAGPDFSVRHPSLAGLFLAGVLFAFPHLEPGQESMPRLARSLSHHRSVSELVDLHTVLQETAYATEIPWPVLAFIRERLPAGAVFHAPPEDAKWLPMYANVYVTYAGFAMTTEKEYLALKEELGGVDPLFNDRDLVAGKRAIRNFLDRFAVDYVLVSREYDSHARRQFPRLGLRRIFSHGGYSVWEVGSRKRNTAPSPG